MQFYFSSKDGKSRVRKILRKYPELSAAYSKIYVEIFAKEASKGNALKHLAEKLHISKHEIAYIGGGENDLSAFREAGYRFAMGNTVPELKEKAEQMAAEENQKAREQSAENVSSTENADSTGDGVPGNSYPDVRTGIRAQIQHLKAYATTEALNGV